MAQTLSDAETHDRNGAEPPDRSRRRLIFFAAMTVILMAAIEGTIVSTAMPAILSALGGFDAFTWTFAAYFLAQVVTIPVYGGLADIYGRKKVLLFGIALFLVGSVLCGFAGGMPTLVVFRVVQGLGAGALVTLSQTVVGDLYEPLERTRIQGYISGVWGAGAVLGPLLGSFIVTHFTWPWVFWINLPIGCVAAVMIATILKERVQSHARRIDYLGSALLAAGLGALMFALTQASAFPLATMVSILLGAAAALLAFVAHEARTPEPMLPLSLMRNRVVAGGDLACLCAGAVLMGSTAFLSLYVQTVMGLSALIAGFAVGGPSLSWPLGSFLGGRLINRTSYRFTAAIGAAPTFAGVLLLTTLNAERGPLWAAIGPLLIGVGMGFIVPTFVVAIQSAVGWEQRGIATSTTVFSRIAGQAIGSAIFGAILNAAVAGLAPSGSSGIDEALNPAMRQSLAPAETAPLVAAMASGIHEIYLIVAVLVLVMLGAAFALPKGMRPQ